MLQAIDLYDDIVLEPADALAVEGFAEDTLVRAALEALAEAAGVPARWRVRIEKRIPVAAGLGGGSSDAAAALLLANASLAEPLADRRAPRARRLLGADVPFFLSAGPQLGTGDGSDLRRSTCRRTTPSCSCCPNGCAQGVDRGGLRALRRARRRRGLRGAARSRSSVRSTAVSARRPGDAPAERPRIVAPRGDLAGSAPSAPTSPAPARPSTGSSSTSGSARGAASSLAETRTLLARPTAPVDLAPRWPWQDERALGRGQVVRQRVLVP